MINSALITYDLRVLCMQEGRLIARPLDGLTDLSSVVFTKRCGDDWNLATLPPVQWWYDIETGRFDRYAPEGRIVIEGDTRENGICRLTGLDGYFHVKLTGAVEPSGAMSHRRECMFRIIEAEDLRALCAAVKKQWVVGRKNRLVKANSGESTIWDIHFGPLVIEFEDFMTAIKRWKNSIKNELLLSAERSFYRARPYRPVIVYSVLKSELLPELSASLRSLVECGQYQGEVCIASDLPAEHVAAYIPKELYGRYHFVRMCVRSARDQGSPLLALLASGELDHYAPVICFKTSVLVTKTIGASLRRFAQGDHMSAPVLRHFRPGERPDEDQYGGFLSDGVLTKEHGVWHGFSTSILVFPSTSLQAPFLQKALECSIAYLRDRRLPLSPDHEAGIFHYMSVALDGFDPSVLGKGDFNPDDQAIPGKSDGRFLCCEEWLESHRAALMQSHLASLPRTSS